MSPTYRPVTRTDRPMSPGMTPRFFDRSIAKAHELSLTATPTSRPGWWRVDSGTTPGLTYLVSTRSCGCRGNAMFGRCYHVAFVAFLEWIGQDAPADRAPAA